MVTKKAEAITATLLCVTAWAASGQKAEVSATLKGGESAEPTTTTIKVQ